MASRARDMSPKLHTSASTVALTSAPSMVSMSSSFHYGPTGISSTVSDSSKTLGSSEASSQIERKDSEVVHVLDSLPATPSPPTKLYYPKPSRLSPKRQIQFNCLYLAGNTLVSALVSGALGYAISYGLYSPKNPSPKLYSFEGTIIGDIVVTLLIQNIITWITTSISVFMDLRNSRALPWPAPKSLILTHESRPSVLRNMFYYFAGPSRQADVLVPNLPKGERGKRWGRLMLRALLSSLMATPVYSLLSILVVLAIYAPSGVNEIPRGSAYWIKAAVGAIFGALHTPIVGIVGLWSVDPTLAIVDEEPVGADSMKRGEEGVVAAETGLVVTEKGQGAGHTDWLRS
ncbi:hypothetical protein HDU67_008790 [Dinochytrium kinnereticum]|nr:hypothetical protein HDU67_008790 [Dinochytrium kinnereticum]